MACLTLPGFDARNPAPDMLTIRQVLLPKTFDQTGFFGERDVNHIQTG